MTLTHRLIVCLDVDNARVVKGVGFKQLRDVGDPVEMAARYEGDGADEIVFLDVSASVERRGTLLDVVRRTAERLFIPLTVGGGVRTADDMGIVLRAGADKVSVNSAAVRRPELLTEASERFGAQCVVASIDAKISDAKAGATRMRWEVYTHGGRTSTGIDAIAWAQECVARGAGEILLTSIDRDGARDGYDLELTAAVANVVSVPVIASGGAGSAAHVVSVLAGTNADAALVAGVLHDGVTTVQAIKKEMIAKRIPTRRLVDAAV